MSSVTEDIEAAAPLRSRIESVLRFMQLAIGALGGGGTALLMMGPMFAISNNGFLIFALLFPLVIFGSVVLHEAGHALAATLLKMTVLEFRVGPFQCAMQRRSARIRWRPHQEMRRARLSGYILAIPSLEGSLRKQHVWYALGGPLSNLAVTLLAALIGYALLPRPIAFLGFAIAWLNLMITIGNLIPTKRLIDSDGKQVLHWLKAKDVAITPYQRLIALSIQGTRPDEMPMEVIEALDTMPVPMSLIALYMRLQAHQICARWNSAVALESELERTLSHTPPTVAEALTDFLAIIRTELAFSKTMLDRDSRHLNDSLLPRTTAWLVPYLWPRCMALREGLAGNDRARDQQLSLAMRYAEKSVELSVARSEALLGTHIRAI